jgi:hypothetical protein
MVLSKSSDQQFAWVGWLWSNPEHFFSPKRQASNESLILAQNERWRRA